MNYLYHGSTTQNIKILEPRHRYTPAGKINDEAIYATPLPVFAAAQSFPWSSDEGVILDATDEKIKMTVPTGLKQRLSAPISIYKISSGGFEQTVEESTGFTWHTKSPVRVLEEIKYPSAAEAIRSLGGEIIYN
jgi:hypothetical protein